MDKYLFKVNNKGIRISYMDLVRMSLLLTLNKYLSNESIHASEAKLQIHQSEVITR